MRSVFIKFSFLRTALVVLASVFLMLFCSFGCAGGSTSGTGVKTLEILAASPEGEPLAFVPVSALDGSAKVLASSVTDDAGVAMMDLPGDAVVAAIAFETDSMPVVSIENFAVDQISSVTVAVGVSREAILISQETRYRESSSSSSSTGRSSSSSTSTGRSSSSSSSAGRPASSSSSSSSSTSTGNSSSSSSTSAGRPPGASSSSSSSSSSTSTGNSSSSSSSSSSTTSSGIGPPSSSSSSSSAGRPPGSSSSSSSSGRR